MSARRYGSDLIVAMLAEAGIEHVAFNPGASFRGIHDSLVQAQDGPQIALCLHEAASVAVAQGYAKAAGRPMAVLLHDVVGLQNASMAIYNAWCDRAPMLLLGGTGPKSKPRRRPWIDWVHTASVQADLIRDFVKWDDEPHDLASVPESFARGLTAAMAAPRGPVYLCNDAALQEDTVPDDHVAEGIAGYTTPSDPAPSAADTETIVSALAGARAPLILAGYTGECDSSFRALGELAELLGAAVIDTGARLALPTDHPLNATGMADVVGDADVVLALDVDDLSGPLGTGERGVQTLLNVGVGHLKLRGWSDDHQPLVRSEMQVTSTAATTLEALTHRVAELGALAGAQERALALAQRIRSARKERRGAAAGAEADDAVALERLIVELDETLSGADFSITNATTEPLDPRLWTLSRPRQALGWAGGGGLGYGVGAAIGAALANGPDSISVVLQGDGDLLYLPGALWTAAHLRLPVLVVVHNNRQYANTVGHAARIARARGRSEANRHAGAGLHDPEIDFRALASSLGVFSSDPVRDAPSLRSHLEQAIEEVRAGRPALVDVITPSL
jgi:thiamine pyrophosphate-dependent acetolactate synthase large subunit-like protein